MRKQTIRLNESQLHRIIKESVKKVLTEGKVVNHKERPKTWDEMMKYVPDYDKMNAHDQWIKQKEIERKIDDRWERDNKNLDYLEQREKAKNSGFDMTDPSLRYGVKVVHGKPVEELNPGFHWYDERGEGMHGYTGGTERYAPATPKKSGWGDAIEESIKRSIRKHLR